MTWLAWVREATYSNSDGVQGVKGIFIVTTGIIDRTKALPKTATGGGCGSVGATSYKQKYKLKRQKRQIKRRL